MFVLGVGARGMCGGWSRLGVVHPLPNPPPQGEGAKA